MAKTFSIYRSSAGSGKTRTLAKEYLTLALKYRSDYFKHILAVTFTNKASQEMKDRILYYLDEFANGRVNDLTEELKLELNLDAQTFQQRAHETQAEVLHHYSQFSISTIDAFFQKVIRSFTRESGLMGDYRLEVEQDAVLEGVINNLIDELGSNKELTDWVVEFAKENLENERAWDVRYSLIEFAKEIFREEFRTIEEQVNKVTSEKGFFKNLRQTLSKVKSQFLTDVSKPAQEALKIIQANGWKAEDFSFGKNSGLLTFFKVFASERNLSKVSNTWKRIRTHFIHPEKWAASSSPHAKNINRVAGETLVPFLNIILSHYDAHYKKAFSAEVALKNLYVFGLISDISRKLKEYKDENNLMLLADAPKFLNGVIQDSDTPFIYEKVGSFYKNYLIDEFQDTSGLQWKNFQPLITNTLDQGFNSMVVGDVKQAIYRWRGGDLNLLQQKISSLVGKDRTETKKLDCNFRSALEVVRFNNLLFKNAADIIATVTGTSIPAEAYIDVSQTSSISEKGFVHIQFIKEPADHDNSIRLPQDEGGESSAPKWKELALESVPVYIERLQAKGVALRDIAILVRKHEEGQRIAGHLLQYKQSEHARPDCRYDVVSNESLRIDGASTVNLLLGAMRYLLNPEDSIARAQLGYEYSRLHEPNRIPSEVFSVANQSIFENNLPDLFTKEKGMLKKLALLELTETLIRIFQLGSIKGELIYLQAFQDIILDFCNRERNDLAAFLEWWEDNKHKNSVQVSGQVDAIQILTIHKAKGLQFPYVILPFCSWGLDHDNWQSPNLWISSSEAPFSEAGYLPVRYGKYLEETFFAASYREEKTRIYLDNLNLLYVALTRAKYGMIIQSPSFEIRGAKDSVAGLLHNSIQGNEELKSRWDHAGLKWSSGEWNVFSGSKNNNSTAISLEKYHVASWQDKLVIKKSGSEFFDNDYSEQRQKINYGIQMHAVLSRIKTSEEITDTIGKVILEGLITEAERTPITLELRELFQLPTVASWFEKGLNIRTEIPIITPDGNEHRVDRLILKDEKAIVIDFKTGEPKKSDNLQVLDYMKILRQMNYYDVKGYLLYLREKTVVEVKAEGKTRMVRKNQNKDQLSLGL